MGIDLSKADNVLQALRASEQEAAAAYAALEKVKADVVASGVNPLTDAEAFSKIDEAGKVYDLKAQEAEELKDRLGKLQGFERPAPTGSRLPAPGVANASRPNTIFALGARVTSHELYRQAQQIAAQVGDASFSATLKDAFAGGIPLLSREEFQAMIVGRYGATVISGGGATSAGPFIQNDLQADYVGYNRKTPSLASIVGRGETDSDVVEYVSQSAPTNNAAPTGETNNAGESAYPFATNTTNVQEIVHFVPITRRAMQDAGQMRSIIEGELVIDLLDKLDDQLASGAGTGDELEGIYTAVSQSQALGGDSRADALHKAMTKIRIAAGVRLDPDYIGIHPNDYEDLVLEVDGNGRYLLGDPNVAGPRSIWGVPFVVSTVFTDGTPLVGNFQRGARLWMRSGVELLSGLNDNDFIQRRISLMATMRAAFKTIRITAFTEVTGF